MIAYTTALSTTKNRRSSVPTTKGKELSAKSSWGKITPSILLRTFQVRAVIIAQKEEKLSRGGATGLKFGY